MTRHDASDSPEKLGELYDLCNTASNAQSWGAIRDWFSSHSREDARRAARFRGEYKTTPLHLVCRSQPPIDVVDMLIDAYPNSLKNEDSFGWLPIHFACAGGASQEVLFVLVYRYPESKLAADKCKRIPLHFILTNANTKNLAVKIQMLTNREAILYPDENGMLPLHYACAYGATEEALRVLTDNHVETTGLRDNHGRTPLHFGLGNADRPHSPAVVKHLLDLNCSVVNSVDREGNLPLQLLATKTRGISKSETDKRENCRQCVQLYLDAEPRATADLLTGLQALPGWLRDYAVVNTYVQNIINIKMSKRFPTAVMLMDFAFLIIVIVFFHASVRESLQDRYRDDGFSNMNKAKLIPLYMASFYFTLREVAQAISLASLGIFETWWNDRTNWFDISYIILVSFWTIDMQFQLIEANLFQTGAALSLGIFWTNAVVFLKAFFVEFAVFVGGLHYVMKRFMPALIMLLVVLVGFAQMFHTLYWQTAQCPQGSLKPLSTYILWPGADNEEPDHCEPTLLHPWCNKWSSLFKVLTMLLGEVDDEDFVGSKMSKLVFAAFMFIAVILLANILIAIVTDSYGVIKNERAAAVFWSNRLDFVTEMDVISNGFNKRYEGLDDKCDLKAIGTSLEEHLVDKSDLYSSESDPFFLKSKKNDLIGSSIPATFSERSIRWDETLGMDEALWLKCMDVFDEDIYSANNYEYHFCTMIMLSTAYALLRIFTAIIIIPAWIFLGFVTFGLLWPPQVRICLLTVRFSSEKQTAAEEMVSRITDLRDNIATFRTGITSDLGTLKKDIDELKNGVDTKKSEIQNEMNEVRKILSELYGNLSEL